MTNLDNIRQMNSEELTEYLRYFNECGYCVYSGKCDYNSAKEEPCFEGVKKWLNLLRIL